MTVPLFRWTGRKKGGRWNCRWCWRIEWPLPTRIKWPTSPAAGESDA
jgi:hypothetical protein